VVAPVARQVGDQADVILAAGFHTAGIPRARRSQSAASRPLAVLPRASPNRIGMPSARLLTSPAGRSPARNVCCDTWVPVNSGNNLAVTLCSAPEPRARSGQVSADAAVVLPVLTNLASNAIYENLRSHCTRTGVARFSFMSEEITEVPPTPSWRLMTAGPSSQAAAGRRGRVRTAPEHHPSRGLAAPA
jgi:hypothetical protein